MNTRFVSSKIRIATLAAVLTGAGALHGQSYLFTDLSTYTGLPSDYVACDATGINNSGVVVGYAANCCGSMAARFDAGQIYTYPSLGPAHSSFSRTINNAGDIAGWCARSGSSLHAYYIDAGGFTATRRDIHPALVTDPTYSSDVIKINDRGELVGRVTAGAPAVHRYSYLGYSTGEAWSLAPVLGAGFQANDLNNGKEIVGNGKYGGMIYHRGTGAVELVSDYLGTYSNTANAINDAIEVAGTVGGTTGYLLSAGATYRFGGGSVQAVNDINGNGDVVGTTTRVDSDGRGFLYVKATHSFIDVNTLGGVPTSRWTLVTATGINDSGAICGMARRYATPNDHVSTVYVYAPYKLTPWYYILTPVFPFTP